MNFSASRGTLWGSHVRSIVADISFRSIRAALGRPDLLLLGAVGRVQGINRDFDTIWFQVERAYAEMGVKRKLSQPQGSVVWVNHKLTEAEKEAFASWDAPPDDVARALVQLISDGYKLYVSYDNIQKCPSMTVICWREGHVNYGKGFSTWAREWEKLCALVVWKHFSLWAEGWPDVVPPTARGDFG